MSISLIPEYPKSFGRVESMEQVEGDFGEQVRIVVVPSDPRAVTNYQWFTPYDKKPSGRLMKFVSSFSRARIEAIKGPEVKDSDEVVGSYIAYELHIVEMTLRDGRVVNPRQWLVTNYFTSEEDCRNAWAAYKGVEVTVATDAPPEVPAAPAVPPVAIPAQIAATLKAMLAKSGKPLPVFYDTEVKSWGYTLEQVMLAVQ